MKFFLLFNGLIEYFLLFFFSSINVIDGKGGHHPLLLYPCPLQCDLVAPIINFTYFERILLETYKFKIVYIFLLNLPF